MPTLLALLLWAQEEPNDIEQAVRRFAQAYALVERHNADPVNPSNAFYEAALPGMLRALDPHSAFLTQTQMEQLRDMERSTSKGFGTVVSVLPGRVIVLQVLPGAPSSRAGIAPGDEIVGINNIRLDGLTMEQLIGVLGETRQRQALLHVRRPGNAVLMRFTLTPEEMASPSVDRAFLIRPGIGFVRATSFEGQTGKQMKEAIEKLGGRDLKGLVLDLRNNGGGVVQAAIETAALFLAPGKKILTVRGRARPMEEVTAPGKSEPYTFPMAVLINERTASAAEIVAGALQDHDRATIVGTPSYGKGLVQSVFPVSEGNGIALTTAFYFTPSGRSIQRPLKEGQLDSNARYANLETATEFRTAGGRPVKGGGGIEPDEVAHPDGLTALQSVIDASGLLTTFATEYLARKPSIDRNFRVSDELLSELQGFLAERRIQPGLLEWSRAQAWIRSRLQQEIFNQALGVEAGDEVEFGRDGVVRAALRVLSP